MCNFSNRVDVVDQVTRRGSRNRMRVHFGIEREREREEEKLGFCLEDFFWVFVFVLKAHFLGVLRE